MSRMIHGMSLPLEQVTKARAQVSAINQRLRLPFSLVPPPNLTRFGYLFPELQEDPNALLPDSSSTIAFLTRLGETMSDPGGASSDSSIPAAYTYFGQFVDHDITLELRSQQLADFTSPSLAPLSRDIIRKKIKNGRSATLDLDSVYRHPAPRRGYRMEVGKVSASGNRPDRKKPENDLPRRPPSSDPIRDREAMIGDARNDENLIIAQLHVAFLHAHNAIAKKERSFYKAQRLLRQHYQWIVIHDFLPKIVDKTIVNRVLAQQSPLFNGLANNFFLPLEFTVAAYRFGHSMIRSSYNFNVNFPNAQLGDLFTFTAFAGGLNGNAAENFPTLPEKWIIQWENFLNGTNLAQTMNTRLVEPLFALRNEVGGPLRGGSGLAVRNLLRGYLLRIPTGQAVARAIGVPPLERHEIIDAGTLDQMQVLDDSGFSTRTPLWYYILAEAAHHGGNRLGPVGSTIVAEVLIGLVRRSEDSILSSPGWAPSLGPVPGQFTLADLLRLGGVLS
jgi:hypothetical protein